MSTMPPGKLTTVSFYAAVLPLLVALLAQLGWMLDIEVFKSIIPGFIVMNPATAIAFVFLSIGLLLARHKREKIQLLIIVCGLGAAVIGVLKLLELFLGFPLAVDQLFFSEKLHDSSINFTSRMAQPTATNLFLLGVSLTLFGISKKMEKVSLTLSIISLVITFNQLFGYFYNLLTFDPSEEMIPMAINTIFNFLLIVIAMIILISADNLKRIFSQNGKIVQLMNNLSIRRKLLLAFGIFVFLMLLFSLIISSQMREIQNDQLPARANVREATTALESMRKNIALFLFFDLKEEGENSFYVTGVSPRLVEQQQNYQQLVLNLDRLEAYSISLGDTDAVKELRLVREYVADYNLDFLESVGKYKHRGFVNYGIEGQMREAVHQLEEQLAGNNEAMVALLEARRREKDFMIRRDLQYVESFNEAVQSLRDVVSADPELVALVDEYDLRFQQIVQLESEIGLKFDDGLIGKQNATMAKITPLVEMETDKIINATNKNIAFIGRSLILLSLLFAGLGTVFAYAIAELISTPLTKLKLAATALAQGNFSTRVNLSSKDEVGELGQAFNLMSEKIQQATHKLREANAKNQAVLEGIGDGVFALDTDGKIVLFNPVASNISGFSAEDVMGKHYSECLKFLLENTNQSNDSFIQRALQGENTSMTSHTVLQSKSGEMIPVADSAAPILDEHGKVQGVVVVFRDVTKERELERLKDEFVSIASHELRTPMTAIKGFVSMIREGEYGEVPPRLEEPLKDVFTSTERLIHLVNDMLNTSRIESGRQKFVLVELDIKPLVEQVIASLQPIAKDKNIELLAEGMQSQVVQTDKDKLQQVLTNILGNSLKFTDRGSITVSFSLKSECVELAITDTGIGIAKEDQGRLFNKFTQLSTQEAGRPAGTGLGLYISKELAKKMGGDLWLDSSEPGKGSTFILSVPLSDSKAAQQAKKLIDEEASNNPDQKL